MDWKGVLADLRAHLPQEGGGQRRGSLRWLEAEMEARGANPASLRNIVYRDVGRAADKAALRAILAELARDTGRPLPESAPAPQPPPLPDGLDLLGRSKKRAYRQFLAGVRSGRFPRLIVSGRAGAGKTVLLDGVAQALEQAGVPVRRLSLSGDASAELNLPPWPGGAYAVQAQVQADGARGVLPGAGALLIRVTDDLNFRGEPPRAADGSAVPAARWAVSELLERARPGVAVLLAVESRRGLEGGPHEVIDLTRPSLAEARSYLMARLGVARPEAEALIRDTGRHLDRLTLLVSLRSGEHTAGNLLSDPDTRQLVEASAALSMTGLRVPAGIWPAALLRAVLGQPARTLPPHARALLRGSEEAGWTPSPVLQAAWPAADPEAVRAALRRLGGDAPDTAPQPATDPASADASLDPHRMAALALLGDWTALAARIGRRPDDSRHLPSLWPLIRQAAGGEEREALARATVAHHAGRGEYTVSTLRDALFTLLESPRDPVRAWARVKLAESSLEGGRMDAARSQLDHPDVTAMRGHDPWTVAAQADALLVQAALARWEGNLEAATRAVADPRTAVGGPRALLWRGLIAKDAGRWVEALDALQAVPASSPLLSARARYQEGDLRLRLGQAEQALVALQDAAGRLLLAGASAEECARVLARSATALRRLGRPQEALNELERALILVPDDPRRQVDGVPRARLLSEGLPILLALNRPDEAMAQGSAALALLRRSDLRPAETVYRERRTRYRLALASLTRGLGVPYLQPFGGPLGDHPDLAQARTLLDALIAQAPAGSDRERTLLFDMCLSRALAEPDPGQALEHAQRALDMTTDPAGGAYEEAQARAMRAEALLRGGQGESALLDINRAHALLRRVHGGPGPQHPPDPGLLAQLLALEARATIQDGTRTLVWLRDALGECALAPFRAGVWREAGLALERNHPDALGVLRGFAPGHGLDELRPPDVLRVLCMKEVVPAPPD